MKGKLAISVKVWEEVLQAPDWIVNVIKSGYVMPFTSPPTKVCKSNHNSGLVNVGVQSTLLVVESSTGKKRFVLNLQHASRFLQILYEDLRIAMLLFERCDYMYQEVR